MLGFQSTKTFFLKDTCKIGRRSFAVSKTKNTVPQTHVIIDLNDEKIGGSFYEKELQETSHEEFRIDT